MPRQNAQAAAEYSRDYYDRNRNAVKDRQRQRDPAYAYAVSRKSALKKFNMTPEQYDAMLLRQDGRCKICGIAPTDKKLAVDHDHACCPAPRASCGQCVRGLLCSKCNWLVAALERPNLLESVAQYLRETCVDTRGGYA